MNTFSIILGEHQIAGDRLLRGLLIVSGGCALTYGLFKLWPYAAIAPYDHSEENRVLRALQRAVVDKTKTPVKVDFYPLDSLRSINPRRSNENGHAVSGAVRDAARRLIDEAIDVTGGTKFEINPNPNSSTGPRNHFHFAVGDLAQDFRNDKPAEDAFIVGVDIDYYIREPDVLLQYMRPIVIHTFNPTKVSGLDADSPFTIRDNLIDYRVSGGATWKHPVWNWCEAGEFISSRVETSWRYWFLTLPLRVLGLEKVGYHKIHHSRPWADCPDRALVYTVPQCTVWRFKWISSEINVRKLERIRYQDNTRPGWNRVEHITKDNKVMVSLGREGELAQVSIERQQLDMLQGLSATQSVNARLIGLGYKDPQFTSLIIQYYTGKKVEIPIVTTVYKPTMPRVHWPVTSDADVPEVSARQYTLPIVSDSMLMPMIKRWETMSESIERRVTFVRNDKVPSNHIAKMTQEFVELLNGDVRGSLEPLSIEETIERLDKPSQQLQLRAVFETLDMKPRELISAFNKNEPGMKSSRIISGFADILFILKVSRYTLAYSDSVLKTERNKHWYVPGLNPSQIADKVVNFVSQNDGDVIETDFSNLDGRVSGWMQRNIAQSAMVKAFKAEHRDEIRSFMDTIINCPAQAKRFGFRYEPGVGVKSGSPTTTPHNTIYNAAVEYVALRLTHPTGLAEQLYECIGPKCGDDGLSSGVLQAKIGRAAKLFGLELKVERYNPEVGLCFLSRVFIDPLNTNTTIQDPLRTLRKLHLTTRDPTIPLADAACDRVEGYLCTDLHTPLISDYCKMVLRLYTPIASMREIREKRRSRNKEKPYWMTCDGSWPQNPDEAPMMKQIIVNRTGIDSDDVERLIGRFTAMKDIWEPITYDTQTSSVAHTIDEEGVSPGSVDKSFTKLQYAKQTRANQETARSHKRRDTRSMGTEVRSSTSKRAKGPQQHVDLSCQNKANNQQNGNRLTTKTKCGGLPGRSTTTRSKTNARGAPSQARASVDNPNSSYKR
nr:MAG: RNA-dependent RNA polymerase [Xinjiang mountain noda-like virus 1]